MSAFFMVGVIATASDTYAPQPPNLSIDGSATTYWSNGGTGLPSWLRYQLPTATALTGYTLTPDADVSRKPITWTFEGSNDGTSFTTLDTQTSIVWTGTTPQTFNFANVTAYLYYKLNVTVKSGGGGYLRLSEIALLDGGATAAGLFEAYVETLTIPTSTPVRLNESYIEALAIPITTPTRLVEAYIEVLTPTQLLQPFKGWGVPI